MILKRNLFLAALLTFLPAHPGKASEEPPEPSALAALHGLREGEEISAKLQAAIDAVRSRGGKVVLPPGHYRLAESVNLAGSLRKYPTGAPGGITLEGNGAVLEWTGADEEAVIDLPGIAGCTLKNFRILGEKGRSWRKVAGLRYRGGLERRNNGGKNNLFESIGLENLGIGVEVGGLLGPDLVGGTFVNVAARQVRIGFRFMGANVTSMILLNPVIEGYREAGVQLIAFPGRQIRADENEPMQERSNPDNPTVLTDADGEKEIFRSDLPAWLQAPDVTYPTRWVDRPNGERLLYAGGGSLDVTLLGLQARTDSATAWAIDTNWGAVRVYSGRVEGVGGVFRARAATGFQHYTTVLNDIAAPHAAGLHGNSVEYSGKGPLSIKGGFYGGSIAVGNGTRVFSQGPRFGNDAGVRQLPGTGKAEVDQPSIARRFTVFPGAGKTQFTMEALFAAGVEFAPAFLPNFPSGGVWLERRDAASWTLHWKRPAPGGAAIDIVFKGEP